MKQLFRKYYIGCFLMMGCFVAPVFANTLGPGYPGMLKFQKHVVTGIPKTMAQIQSSEPELKKRAMQGDTMAMMKLFSIKSFGSTAHDWMESYAWGCLALKAGFPDTLSFNQRILDESSQENLTSDQYLRAKKMAARLIKEVLGPSKTPFHRTPITHDFFDHHTPLEQKQLSVKKSGDVVTYYNVDAL